MKRLLWPAAIVASVAIAGSAAACPYTKMSTKTTAEAPVERPVSKPSS